VGKIEAQNGEQENGESCLQSRREEGGGVSFPVRWSKTPISDFGTEIAFSRGLDKVPTGL
jgi:hypothetical protein